MISLRHFLVNTFLPAICVLGIIYNFLIALNGEEGIRARELVREKLVEKRVELADAKVQHSQLENRATLLSLRTLDDDMLDESARKILGYAAEDEYVLSMNELERLIRRKSPQ